MNEEHIWNDKKFNGEKLVLNGDIIFDNVYFEYPIRNEVSVLRGLNLIARVGQTTALVGSSGSGKSTCISLLLRLYDPSSGCIKIKDQSIDQFYLKELRENIGVVNQEPVCVHVYFVISFEIFS